MHRSLVQFAQADGTEEDAELRFPASLSSEEMKYVHHLCQQFGLKFKGRVCGANRQLTVARKEGAPAAAEP